MLTCSLFIASFVRPSLTGAIIRSRKSCQSSSGRARRNWNSEKSSSTLFYRASVVHGAYYRGSNLPGLAYYVLRERKPLGTTRMEFLVIKNIPSQAPSIFSL